MRKTHILLLGGMFFSILSCKKDKIPHSELDPNKETLEANVSISTLETSGIENISSPAGIAVDTCGCLYVTEPTKHQIKKVSSKGEVSILAGSGTEGNTDGKSSKATFSYPTGIVADFHGNVYVTDLGNSKIRKINAKGEVSTVAGNGIEGQADGNRTSASFNRPTGIAMDKDNNLYVADAGNFKIRKISPSGDVTTYAGTGTKGSLNGDRLTATFGELRGLVIDEEGNLYVTESFRVRKISTSGHVSTYAGTGLDGFENGLGSVAKFSNLQGIAVDKEGIVYLADFGNSRVRKISASNAVTTFAIGTNEGTIPATSFKAPFGLAIDPKGNIFISDPLEGKIRKITIK